MSDFLTSLLQFYKSRAKTQLFGIFGFWWVMFHAEYFIVLFFVKQELIYEKTDGLLKNEYLNRLYGSYLEWEYLTRFLLPFLMTWITIWLLPRWIINRSYKKEKDNEYDRQKIKVEHDSRIDKLKAVSEKKEVESLERRESVKKRQQKIEEETPEVIWDREYAAFTSHPLFGKFDQLIDALYEHSGRVNVADVYGNSMFALNRDMLAYADSSGLIDYDRAKDKISLTNKGKFFVRKFQDSGKLPF